MTDPEQDEVFAAYLQRRPVLPALDDEIGPPAALDQSVLNQAREAIQPPGATAGSHGMSPGSAKQRPPRWAVPVALAATILLCLSVVMNISLNTNRHPSPNLERMTAARADLKASALANATAESDAAAGVSAPAAARDAVTSNNGERRESVSGDIPSHEVVLPRAKVAGTPAPHSPVLAEPAAPASASGNVRGGEVSSATAAADKAVLMAKEVGVAAPQYTPAPEAERAAASARKAAKATVVAPHPADPKAWLQQIAALRAAGKVEQADAEMGRFKAIFPNYGAPPATPDIAK